MGDTPSDTPTFAADEATAATAAGDGPTVAGRATAAPARYHDRDSLGRGGMGEVRRCDDAVIGRDVAFKAMRPGGSPEARLRFLHEARLQARLEHPSIVPVYDMGTDPDGNPWFTMRRIDGVTLERVIEHLAAGDPEHVERWGRRRLLVTFVQVCQAVAYAHRHGVVHRDIKPSNVILTDDGGVYLLDWGIAKLQDPAAPEPAAPDRRPTLELGDGPSPTTPRTAAGSILGTLGYMPPEQLDGAGAAVDGRADVYALGATLYELLTLEPLHARQSPPQLVASTLDGADARARVRVPAADVPPELEAVCVRATATAPEDRYPDVPAMIDAIEAYADGDRDLQQRRALAEQHAARAHQLAESTELERRAAAMREAGRALALDPGSTPALRVVTRLLLEPPPTVPEAVEREVRRTDADNARAMARFGTWARGSTLVTILLVMWMGVRSWPLLVLIATLTFFSAVSARRGSKSATGRGVPVWVQVINAVLLGLLATIAGPFMVVPALATSTAVMFVLAGSRRLWGVIALGCAPTIVPFVLERLSLLSHVTTTASGDALTIHPWIASFAPVPTYALLLLSSITSMVLAVITMADTRDRLADARREQLLQAWHLRHLVPHAAGEHGDAADAIVAG
jgi:serine/threonine protein kinase